MFRLAARAGRLTIFICFFGIATALPHPRGKAIQLADYMTNDAGNALFCTYSSEKNSASKSMKARSKPVAGR